MLGSVFPFVFTVLRLLFESIYFCDFWFCGWCFCCFHYECCYSCCLVCLISGVFLWFVFTFVACLCLSLRVCGYLGCFCYRFDASRVSDLILCFGWLNCVCVERFALFLILLVLFVIWFVFWGRVCLLLIACYFVLWLVLWCFPVDVCGLLVCI